MALSVSGERSVIKIREQPADTRAWATAEPIPWPVSLLYRWVQQEAKIPVPPAPVTRATPGN